MVLEKLGSSISSALRGLAGKSFIDKEVVEEFIRDLQRALLQADANVKLVFELSNRIRGRVMKEKPKPGLTDKEHMIKIVYEELVNFLGRESPQIRLEKHKILLVGLFGAGKTTTSAKLARFYQKKGLKPALVGCDSFRPAAQEQIKQLAKQLGIPSYAEGNDPARVATEAIKKFANDADVLIFDSAGRNALDETLAEELKRLAIAIRPDEVLLVVPADIGQVAGTQAEEFNKIVSITGIIITRMDGTGKAGGALSSCASLSVPVKFIGVGEKTDAFEVYDPKRLVSRMTGYGDLQTLLEKAQEADAGKVAEKLVSGRFDMNDFYEQIKSMQKMGPLKQITQMLPGVSLPEGVLQIQESKMKKWGYAIQSMTQKERNEPDSIDSSRIQRIARGSGLNAEDVRELIKQYAQTKKMMKMVGGGKGLRRGMFANLAKQFGIRM